jgi:phospholipase/carboxylesterase
MVADMADSAARLVALVEGLRRTRPTRGKPVVTGFSQGGMLSFALAAGHAEHFAAAVPIAGAIPAALYPTGKASLPVEALHGAADDRVPTKAAQESVAALKAKGYAATLRTWPGVGHTINPEMRQALFDALARRLPQ